jgi:transcriptional regulator with XRE-family HTH domain
MNDIVYTPKAAKQFIPAAVREHYQLTQATLAQRMGITQGAYAQLEAKKKIARALGLDEIQLDF